MKIEIRGPAFATCGQADEKLTDANVLSGLNGVVHEGNEIGIYLDKPLVEIGVVGGQFRCAWEKDRGLELVIDLWSPRSLEPTEIESLANDCLWWISDEFDRLWFHSRGEDYLVSTAWSRDDMSIHQFEDGKVVAPPPHVALAVMQGDLSALTQLLEQGGDCNQFQMRLSALHWAIVSGQPQAAVLLLQHGANPNAVGREQWTPLILCAMSPMTDDDSLMVAKELVRRGADWNYTKDGCNALDYAQSRNKPKLAEFLQSQAS